MSSSKVDFPEPEKGVNITKKTCCKKAIKYLFSHVGLVIMVVLYAIAGSFLFELLEKHEEVRRCEEGKNFDKSNITKYRQDFLNYVQFNISRDEGDGGDNETVAATTMEAMLTKLRDNVLYTASTRHFIGQKSCDDEARWDFNAGILFSVAVFATIGYGNITPLTWEGQIVCICYAVIGIPLYLMCLANIGGVLGDMFRFMYGRVCCRLCVNNNKKNTVVEIKHQQQPWSTNSSGKPGSSRSGAAIVEDDIDDEEEEEEDDKVRVPLTITLMIIGGYITAGAFLFGYFENWQPVESAYFCFITLSTIGFGDYVPGQNPADKQKSIKLIIGAVYMVFGMATIGMCFELMQEEVINKITWIGRSIGLTEKPAAEGEDGSDEENDDDDDEDEYTKEPVKNDYPFTTRGTQNTVMHRPPSAGSRPPSSQGPGSRPLSVPKGPPPTEYSRQESPQGTAIYRPARPPSYHPGPNDYVEETAHIGETDA